MEEKRNRPEAALFDELIAGKAKVTTVYSRRQKDSAPRQPLQEKPHNELNRVQSAPHSKSKRKIWLERSESGHLPHRREEQHRQSWVDRSLSLRRRRSSIICLLDASEFSASAGYSVGQQAFSGKVFPPCDAATQQTHRRKNKEAPKEYVEQQQAMFAEIDAFELEEAIPSPIHSRDWVDGSFDAAAIDITTSFHARYAPLEAVPEDTSPSSYVFSRTKHMLAAALGTPPPPCTGPEVSAAETSGLVHNNGSHIQGPTLDCAHPCINLSSSRATPVSVTQGRSLSLSKSSRSDGARRDSGRECHAGSPLLGYQDAPRRLSFNTFRQPFGFAGERGELIQEHRTRQAHARSPVKGFSPAHQIGAVIADLGALNLGGRLLHERDELYAAILEEEDDNGTAELLPVAGSGCRTLEAEMVQGGNLSSVYHGLLKESGQTDLLTQREAVCSYCNLNSITKIGEGTFGEAFKDGDTVLKIVPVDGDFRVNGELQKTSSELYDEVLLSSTLNKLHMPENANFCCNFITTKGIKFCQGKYDEKLVRAWEEWDSEHTSENDHPMIFPDHQLYVIFVLADGGKDLESFALSKFEEVQSLLMQVVLSLAVAESACEFEHRDLHWGNIVLARKQEGPSRYSLDGKQLLIQTYGMSVSIIDFTLSRINTGEQVLFCNLGDDPEVFGGPARDIQADTYRGMFKITNGLWEGRSLGSFRAGSPRPTFCGFTTYPQ